MNLNQNKSQDFELNLAPIIDCFTVLITFLLVSASFLSIGIFDAGAGIATVPAQNETPPPITIEIDLQSQFKAQIKLTGKSNETFSLPSKTGEWDYEGVERVLTGLKTKWPTTDSVVLKASDEVEYFQIIQFMDRIHKMMPGIILGGF